MTSSRARCDWSRLPGDSPLYHPAREVPQPANPSGTAAVGLRRCPAFLEAAGAVRTRPPRHGLGIGDHLTPGTFPDGGGLQECVLAQVKAVPGRADESGWEQA